ncbi:MAG TPA: hypothetical protein VHX15_19380 [Frankiaceae bacterium]|jgi:hypothetical protein|nr:hypothetical protein [Frankiaceae bacterium]
MRELAAVLGRERVQLEFLLFKVLALQNLLRSGETRFLRWSVEEINRASERVRETELRRVQRVGELATAAGVGTDEMTLSTLAGTAPEPWRTIFADHDRGFRQLAVEVEDAFVTTCALADASGHAIAGLLRTAYRPASPVPIGHQRQPVRTMILP